MASLEASGRAQCQCTDRAPAPRGASTSPASFPRPLCLPAPPPPPRVPAPPVSVVAVAAPGTVSEGGACALLTASLVDLLRSSAPGSPARSQLPPHTRPPRRAPSSTSGVTAGPTPRGQRPPDSSGEGPSLQAMGAKCLHFAGGAREDTRRGWAAALPVACCLLPRDPAAPLRWE